MKINLNHGNSILETRIAVVLRTSTVIFTFDGQLQWRNRLARRTYITVWSYAEVVSSSLTWSTFCFCSSCLIMSIISLTQKQKGSRT